MVGVIDSCIRYPLGSRIKVGPNSGTVKYVGEVTGHAGTWLGIEWDDPARGKHNGFVDGKRYFQTHHATAGSFMRVGKVGPCQSLEEAVRERYHGYTANSLDEQSIREAQQTFQASFIEIVGMEKLARKQSKFEELTEISVDGCPVNSAGYLLDFTKLTSLNLRDTLISSWETVADVLKQVPTLVNLDLSRNRMQLPSDSQVAELKETFRHLQHINMGSCGFTSWSDVIQTARLWPNILSLGLQDNAMAELSAVNCAEIFTKLRELDLHHTKLIDFEQICKLGNIGTLQSLNIMGNDIEEIRLPDCDHNAKLNIFKGLEQLNLQNNPIWKECDAFNELDKLPNLKRLYKTPHLKSSFDDTFSTAVAAIGNLEVFNKTRINDEDRRGAEYDMWKKYALEWIVATKTSPDVLLDFYKKHRTYASIIAKYGSPAEFVPLNITKPSKLIKIRILNKETGDIWEKKLPRMITVQTLQGLVVKHFNGAAPLIGTTAPLLSYIDAKHPDLIVPLDNTSKVLDFYSMQENDTVVVEW